MFLIDDIKLNVEKNFKLFLLNCLGEESRERTR